MQSFTTARKVVWEPLETWTSLGETGRLSELSKLGLFPTVRFAALTKSAVEARCKDDVARSRHSEKKRVEEIEQRWPHREGLLARQLDVRSLTVWPQCFHRFNELACESAKMFLRPEFVMHRPMEKPTMTIEKCIIGESTPIIILHVFSSRQVARRILSLEYHPALPSGFFKLQTGKA